MTIPLTLVSSDPQSNSVENYTAGSLEADCLDFVQKNYEKIKMARRGTERQWYINLAYNFGQQNVVPVTSATSSNGFRLNVPKAPPWRVRLIINHVRRIVRKEMATLFSQKPRFEVVPASTDDKDLIAARAGEQIFDWFYDNKDLATRFKEAGWWACITGTGFMKSYWDSTSEDNEGVQGEICAEAVTPFHLYVPDFRATDIEHQPYVIHATTKDPQYVANAFNMKVAPNTTATNSILDDVFLGMIGTQSLSANQVLILECWIKPKVFKRLPKGGVVTVAGGRIAQITDSYPYKHGQFPFSRLVNIPSGKFYGESMVTDILPIQKEYNRTRSQIVEAKNLMSKPKLIAAQGSIDPNKITSEPGQVVLYKLGFPKPEPLQNPELPGYVMQTIELLRNDMDDISGQHDASQGQAPAGTSATALSFLQEQDDTMLSDTTDSLESVVQKVGRQVLGYVSQYWNEGRLVKVVGTDEAFDATVYKSEDLQGNTDLRVESGSALPKSKAAKQAFVMDLMKMQLIPPQEGLEMLDIGGIDKIYDDVLADKRQAQRENVRLQQGIPDGPGGKAAVPVNEWDNHQLHIQVHNRFRKSQTFELLSDAAKTAFQNHVKTHQASAILQQNGDPTGSGEPDNGLPATAPPPGAEPPNGIPGGAPAPSGNLMPQPTGGP